MASEGPLVRLDAFRGNWALTRSIEDLRGARSGRFVGSASFLPAPQGLDYVEAGAFILGGAAYAASRRYVWTEGGAGSIEVRFPDGRFFHRFLADEARPAAEHRCPPDLYRVAYDFRRWPRWRAEWRVTGPAKDYALVSDYRPTGQTGETAA